MKISKEMDRKLIVAENHIVQLSTSPPISTIRADSGQGTYEKWLSPAQREGEKNIAFSSILCKKLLFHKISYVMGPSIKCFWAHEDIWKFAKKVFATILFFHTKNLGTQHKLQHKNHGTNISFHGPIRSFWEQIKRTQTDVFVIVLKEQLLKHLYGSF